MPETRDVKVFISWSGPLSKDVAVALRTWLPLLFDRVTPWASDTDIDAGQRGLAQIEAELAGTHFGIVVVTAENQGAPWLNFEAGALSKTISGDVERRVVPLLIDLSGPTQLTGPLAQFQAKRADEEGLLGLLLSLAAVAGIDESVVRERFTAYWPRLQTAVKAALASAEARNGRPKETPRDQADVLDEILLHVRQLRSEGEAAVAMGLATEHEAAVANRRRYLADKRRRDYAGTRAAIEGIAARHKLRLDAIEEMSDGYLVYMAPVGDRSQSDLAAFELELNESIPVRVLVEAAPF